MDLADAKIIKDGNRMHVVHGDDKGLFVEFEKLPVHQEFDSEQAGRPIFKEVDYVTIHFPGDATKRVCRPVKLKSDASTPSDPERFPRQWERYQRLELQVQDGTPLEQWPMLNRADARSYKAINIHTVEALAAVSDQNLDSLGHGGRLIRDKAVAWLAAAKSGGDISRLVSENATLRTELDQMKGQISALLAAAPTSPGAPVASGAPEVSPHQIRLPKRN